MLDCAAAGARCISGTAANIFAQGKNNSNPNDAIHITAMTAGYATPLAKLPTTTLTTNACRAPSGSKVCVFRSPIALQYPTKPHHATPVAQASSSRTGVAKPSPSHAELVAQILQRACLGLRESSKVAHIFLNCTRSLSHTEHRHDADHHQLMVAIVAPAVRVALGEALGMPPGTVVTPQLVTALKKLGFDAVYGMSMLGCHGWVPCTHFATSTLFHPQMYVVQQTSPSWRRAQSCCDACKPM